MAIWESLSNHNITSFSVDTKEMLKTLEGLKEEFENHLYDLTEVEDTTISDENYECDWQTVVVGIKDTVHDIIYNVKYSFVPVISGDAIVTSTYTGYDDYYGKCYDVDIELNEVNIECFNEDGDIGYEIDDVTIEGSTEDMNTFNSLPVDDRIKKFREMYANMRGKEGYIKINLSDYIFDNISDLY